MQPAEQLTFLVLKKEGIRRVRVHTYTTHMYETGKDYKTLSGKGGESYGGGTWRRRLPAWSRSFPGEETAVRTRL